MEVLSYYRIEKLIVEHTGVDSIEHDICPNICVAFTGPYLRQDKCPIYEEDHYGNI